MSGSTCPRPTRTADPVKPRPRRLIDWCIAVAGVVVALVALVIYLRRDDVLRTMLDPKQPFQTWRPPSAPDYAQPGAWALIPPDPDRWTAGGGPADVFFVHATTYDGGHNWNAAIDDRGAARQLARVMLPNNAGPFQRVGRVFAPRYRQASLYAEMTNRDDAREARRFAYGDVRRAFLDYLARWNHGRPIIVAGMEQGGALAARLLDEVIAPDPAMRSRVVAVYAMETVLPGARYGPSAPFPACAARSQARCLVGWISARESDPSAAARIVERAFVWNEAGRLVPLGPRPPLCVNPLTGAVGQPAADARANLGAANATGLEWGARPAFLPRQVSARCQGGVLRVSAPASPSFAFAGAWADRYKVQPYNLFYADIEADAKARVAAFLGRRDFPASSGSVDRSELVRTVPVHRVN